MYAWTAMGRLSFQVPPLCPFSSVGANGPPGSARSRTIARRRAPTGRDGRAGATVSSRRGAPESRRFTSMGTGRSRPVRRAVVVAASTVALGLTVSSPAEPAATSTVSLSAITARFVPAEFATHYSVRATDLARRTLSYRWTLSLRLVDRAGATSAAAPGSRTGVDRGCNNLGHLTSSAATFVWRHGDASLGGCDHSKMGPSGHQGLVSVVVSDGVWSCRAHYGGTNDGVGPIATCSRLSTNPVTSTAWKCRGPARKLFDNSNGGGVLGGGRPPSFTTHGSTYCVTQLITYHWNGGRGSAPGQIGPGRGSQRQLDGDAPHHAQAGRDQRRLQLRGLRSDDLVTGRPDARNGLLPGVRREGGALDGLTGTGDDHDPAGHPEVSRDQVEGVRDARHRQAAARRDLHALLAPIGAVAHRLRRWPVQGRRRVTAQGALAPLPSRGRLPRATVRPREPESRVRFERDDGRHGPPTPTPQPLGESGLGCRPVAGRLRTLHVGAQHHEVDSRLW